MAGYAYALRTYGANPENVQAMQILASAQQDMVNALDKQTQDLDGLAQISTSFTTQTSAYKRAVDDVSAQITASFKNERDALLLPSNEGSANQARVKQGFNELRGLLAQKRTTPIEGLASAWSAQGQEIASLDTSTGPGADLQRATALLQQLQGQLTREKPLVDASTYLQLKTQVDQQLQTVLQDQLSFYQEMEQATSTYEQAGTADPAQQMSIDIQNLQELYAKVNAAGVSNPYENLQLLGQIRQDTLTRISDIISVQQSENQLALTQSDIGQPQQVQLGNAVTDAQQFLSYVESLPSKEVSPQQLLQAQQTLAQAREALVQFQIQEGQQLIQAESQLAQGQTMDPVTIAQDALAGDRRLLAYLIAHHEDEAQIVAQQAQIANDMKAVLQARWQQTEATTEFKAATYQITGAQEITDLQKQYEQMKKDHGVPRRPFNRFTRKSGTWSTTTAS